MLTGEQLKEKRIALRLTQAELAEKAEIDVVTLLRFEKGQQSIMPGTAKKLQAALHSKSKRPRLELRTGSDITEARLNAGFTLNEFADLIGVDDSTLRYLENGRSNRPRLSTLREIERVLNLAKRGKIQPLRDKHPSLPDNGEWKHDDELIYVTRKAARALGFTYPFLEKYSAKKHPYLGRPISTIPKVFIRRSSDGREFRDDMTLFSLDDLNSILKHRRSAAVSSSGDSLTIEQYARDNKLTVAGVRYRIKKGKLSTIPTVLPRKVRMKAKGRVRDYVMSKPVVLIQPDVEPALNTSTISLPDASRLSLIPLATWHTWTRKLCRLLGRKLTTTKQRGTTSSGHSSDNMDHIALTDYKRIVAGYEEARDGWIKNGNGIYLSPPTIVNEFKMPATTSSATMILGNRRRNPTPELGRPIRAVKGFYFDEHNILQHGYHYHEDDVEQVFERKGAKPIRSKKEKADSQTRAVDTSKPSTDNAQTLPTIWRHGTRDYSRDGLRIVRVSPEHENILRAFLETGKRMTTPELEKFGSSNVPQAIDRLTKVGNGVFSDAIQKPDGVRGLGYFIRVRPIAEMD